MFIQTASPFLGSRVGVGGAAAATVPDNSFYVSNIAAAPAAAVGGADAITTGGVAHTKTGYTELFSAAEVSADVHLLKIIPHSTVLAGSQTDFLIDIAIGGAGSETVLVANIPAGYLPTLNGATTRPIYLPIYIPAGTRVSWRAQSLITSDTIICVAEGFGFDSRPNWTFDGIDTYGANTAASQGTSITPGDSGAWGAWASIGSATSRTYNALSPIIQGPMTATANLLFYHWEIGISDTTLTGHPVYRTNVNTNETMNSFISPWIYGSVASAAQLQMRGTCSGVAQAHDGIILAGYIT